MPETVQTSMKELGVGTILSCAKDPYDLRPAVNGLTDAILRVHARLTADRPLIVLLSEEHNVSAIPIMDLMTINRLLKNQGAGGKKPQIAIGIERPHDLFAKAFKEFTNVELTPSLYSRIYAADHDGRKTLNAGILIESVEAPVANLTLQESLRRRRLPVLFNDLSSRDFGHGKELTTEQKIAAMKAVCRTPESRMKMNMLLDLLDLTAQSHANPDEEVRRDAMEVFSKLVEEEGLYHYLMFLKHPDPTIFDCDDPYTEAMLAQYAPQVANDPVDPGSADGLRVRNLVTVTRALQHLRDTKAQIYLQTCGHNHLFGNTSYKQDTYKDSLYAQFIAAGAVVMPVITASNKLAYDGIPPSARGAMASSVGICDYAADRYRLNDSGEAGFILRLASHSKTDMTIYTDATRKENIEQLAKDAVPILAEIRGFAPRR